MKFVDLLGTKCRKCKKGTYIELSVTYTCRVECNQCKAVFGRFVLEVKLP